MIRREVNRDVACSVIEMNGVRHVHVVAKPHVGGSIAEQTCVALQAVRAAMGDHGASESIVEQSIFAAELERTDACRDVVRGFYGREMPATTYVPQIPCGDAVVVVEAFGLAPAGEKSFRLERRSDQLVVVHYDGASWCHCGHVPPVHSNGSVHAHSLDAFGRTADLLEEAGFGFGQIVRTWLYLGDIIGQEGDRQRYHELNRARAEYFNRISFRKPPGRNGRVFYPASTGIGAEGRGLLVSCVALRSERGDCAVVPLENPRQTSAFNYAPPHSPASPRFSRAAAVVLDNVATVFISGTASITESQSRHPDDVELQTHQTLDNVAALIDQENCRSHGLDGFGATLADLAKMRVYLKRASDFEQVREICRRRVGDLPAVYAVADICRPELLVEIEGLTYMRRGRRSSH